MVWEDGKTGGMGSWEERWYIVEGILNRGWCGIEGERVL